MYLLLISDIIIFLRQQKLKADKDDLNKQKNQLLGQVNTLRAELNDLGEKKNNLKRQLDQARIARNQIEQSRRRLSELQRNKIDPDEAKRNFKEDVKVTLSSVSHFIRWPLIKSKSKILETIKEGFFFTTIQIALWS